MSRGTWLGVIAETMIIFHLQNVFNIRTYRIKIILKYVTITILSIAGTLAAASIIVHVIQTNNTLAEIIIGRAFSLFSGKDATFIIRLGYDINGIQTMLNNPLIGIGFGNIFTIFGGDLRNGIPTMGTSSNFLVDIGAEIGILGLLSFVIFMINIYIRGRNTLYKTSNRQLQVIFIGAIASYIGIIINGFTAASHLLPFIWISAGILAVSKVKSVEKGINVLDRKV